jgi:glycosyltransferase involved in cell wall biosynthesis
MNKDISVSMPIYNQEPIIEMVLESLYQNISENVKELIILFDGCVDKSEEIVRKVIVNKKLQPKILYADDVNETISNNMCFRESTCDYVLTIQDDMQILEKDFDARMLKPFEIVENLLGVTARDAQDVGIENKDLYFYNTVGRDAIPPTSRNIFGIRQCINRGPILFHHGKLKEMNYFDEDFAPGHSDDIDLSFRAFRKNYFVGAFTIDYRSDYHWGASRRPGKSSEAWTQFAPIRRQMVIQRHYDLIMSEKNPINIIIE